MAQVGFIRVGARTDEAPIGGGISLVLEEWYGGVGENGLLGERGFDETKEGVCEGSGNWKVAHAPGTRR